MKTIFVPAVVLLTITAALMGSWLSAKEPLKAPATSNDEPDKLLVTRGLMPKEEIGALRFLAKHAEYDGRGVVVAIFDSGVDPGATGLQKTTDGKPKVIDIIDGTGSGDVDMSTVREAKENTLAGLTGRTLKLDPKWAKPGRKFRIGIKRAYDFYPSELVARLKRERRKEFTNKQRACEAGLRRQIIAWDAKHKKPNAKQKRQRADLDARLKQLTAIEGKYDDPGPIFDCVLFHDGKAWQAAVDTDADGDLRDEKLLTNYRDCLEYATFGGGAQLNFGVNIYDKGRTLTIVADGHPHGTHVAGIVAGHFPDQGELNGIAPGAQIVSVKIGDTRLDTMETGSGFIRGLSAVLRNKCDLINMSYGEPSSRPNAGRLVELLSEVVNKHDVIFVSSAGNAGPALSTVGAPGGTSSAMIGVGAYVSPAMMAAGYTLRKKLDGMPYTWTSRGPTFDGDYGVNLFAPGGAISPVPNWTLQRNMLMNGTSMASPNCCGGIALMLSGLKANKVKYSPYSVRRALENTATPVTAGDSFAEGAGLIQIEAAFEHLNKGAEATGELLRFDVNVVTPTRGRGIYLREPRDTWEPTDANVSVRPVFKEQADNRKKVDFEMRIALTATEPWVEVGEHMVLNHGGKTFGLKVNPDDLEPGVHFAEVLGHDATAPRRGPIFRVPVTVIVPEEVPEDGAEPLEGSVEFTPGQVNRRFIAVPADATWMDVTVYLEADGPRRFFYHTVQHRDGLSFEDAETKRFLSLRPGRAAVYSQAVTGGLTMELCLAQYWSSLGESELHYEVTFHGLRPDQREITLTADEPAVRVEVTSPLRKETLDPSAKLDTLRRMVRPTKSVIRPLSPTRDRLINGRQDYELVLAYKFEQDKPGSVTPRFPLNDDLLYDSDYGTQLWLLFDSGKRRIATGDVFPKSVRLGKGEHLLQFQFRHDDAKRLEAVKNMPLLLDRSLGSPVSLSIYPTRTAALAGGAKLTSQTLQVGRRATMYVKAPSSSPGAAEPGDILLGTITYGKDDPATAGSGHRPGGYPIRYVVPVKPAAKAAASSGSDGDVAKAVWTAKLQCLRNLPENKEKEFVSLFDELLKEKRDPMPVLVARLHRLDKEEHRKERLDRVVAAADAVIEKIDTTSLAQHLGTKVNPEDAKAAAEHKKMLQQRDTLVDALYRKGRALGYMELPEVIENHPIKDPEAHNRAFEANFAALRKWVDTTDTEYALLHIRRDSRNGYHGKALELLNKQIPGSAPDFWHYKKRCDLYESLGWKHWEDYERTWLKIRFPEKYEAF